MYSDAMQTDGRHMGGGGTKDIEAFLAVSVQVLQPEFSQCSINTAGGLGLLDAKLFWTGINPHISTFCLPDVTYVARSPRA